MNRKEIERFVKLLDGRNSGSLSIEIDGSVLRISKAMKPCFPAGSDRGIESTVPSLVITSRYVGFFYSTSVSDVVQTLSIGDRVRKSQPLGMVESMGIEHIIKSDVDGILKSVEAIDGQPVEYGQPLFSLELERP